jgi:hypothetical protein
VGLIEGKILNPKYITIELSLWLTLFCGCGFVCKLILPKGFKN